MTGNYSDAAPPYGTPSEKSLYEAWDRHEFCYPLLEKMIGSIEGIVTIFDLGCGSDEMLKRLSQLGKGADHHRTRSISPANGFQCDEREVLQRKVKTAEGLLTESCTRVVTRSAR